jgi:hypothetical protein
VTDEAERVEEAHPLLPPGEGTEPPRPRRDFLGALIFVAIAAGFAVQALRMPFRDPSWEWYTAPNVFPLAMAGCLGVASLFVAIRGFAAWHVNRTSIAAVGWARVASEWGMPRFIAGAAMIAGLVWLLGKVDFYLLAPASIIVFGVAFRSDPLAKALRAALIAAAFILAFLFGISRVFGIVFP